MKMQRNEVRAIAAACSRAVRPRVPRSPWRAVVLPEPDEVRDLQPVCRNVPAEASMSRNATPQLVVLEAGLDDHRLADEPLNSGKAEIESPPTSVKRNVHGIFT
jgi:hypothetical protein